MQLKSKESRPSDSRPEKGINYTLFTAQNIWGTN
jgi:hypothetical protein